MSIWRDLKKTGKLANNNDINFLINSKDWYTEQVISKSREVNHEK